MTREELMANLSRGSEADLRGAYLNGADLRGAKFSPGVHAWQFGPGGSRNDYLVIMQGPALDDVRTGCFHGTLAEFEGAVEQTHGNNQHGRWYRGIIALVRAMESDG